MMDRNESKVLSLIQPGDVVLDVGGWARPFNRANYVLDRAPYETRGEHYARYHNLLAQGGKDEHFTADTWIKRDLCDHTPWPFADKSIDYCICSNTLEDIRDPLWVCHEMVRVARRGYIEVPSRLFETCRGRERNVPVGLSHHWWLIEIERGHIAFYPKYHVLHGDFRLSFPKSFSDRLPDESLVSWLFWEDSFTYSEGDPGLGDELPDAEQILRSFVDRWYQYPGHEYAALDRIQSEYQARMEEPLDPARGGGTSPPGPGKQFRFDGAHADLAEMQARLEAMRAELENLMGSIERAGQQLDAHDLGPFALGLARRLRRASLRFPTLSRAVKRLVRAGR